MAGILLGLIIIILGNLFIPGELFLIYFTVAIFVAILTNLEV